MAIEHKNLAVASKMSYGTPTGSVLGVEYLAYIADGELVIAVRGTQVSEPAGVLDVLRDVLIIPWYSRDAGGFFPLGFVRGSKAILGDIKGILRDNPNIPVSLTGHSLGGAIALLLGEMLVKDGFELKQCVVFGSPKVGKLKHLKGFTQYRNGRDVVTFLPLTSRNPGNLVELPGSEGFFDDHSITEYIAKLYN